ncbi:hypothetical protein VULLAG_LOCUS17619 [Vulpes lagopus]
MCQPVEKHQPATPFFFALGYCLSTVKSKIMLPCNKSFWHPKTTPTDKDKNMLSSDFYGINEIEQNGFLKEIASSLPLYLKGNLCQILR